MLTCVIGFPAGGYIGFASTSIFLAEDLMVGAGDSLAGDSFLRAAVFEIDSAVAFR